jgi:hypothetical protein
MIQPLTKALRQISDELVALLAPAAIRAVCASVGYEWRDRQLDPATTIHLFIPPMRRRNTTCAHLPRLSGRTFSASA